MRNAAADPRWRVADIRERSNLVDSKDNTTDRAASDEHSSVAVVQLILLEARVPERLVGDLIFQS